MDPQHLAPLFRAAKYHEGKRANSPRERCAETANLAASRQSCGGRPPGGIAEFPAIAWGSPHDWREGDWHGRGDGEVVEAYPNASQVLLLTDKESGVGAMLADSRIQSPVGGQGEPLLVMKYVPNDDEVNLGERVITSGMDRIFPRDLPVGTVAEIKSGNPFKQIRIRPAANLERLEEVFVLLSLHPLEMKNEENPAGAKAPARAAATPPPAVTR